MIDVSYRLDVQWQHYDTIIQFIKTFGYEVEKGKPEDTARTATANSIPITIFCKKRFHPEEMTQALALYNALKNEVGITRIDPMFLPAKSHKHIVITVLLSSGIMFGTIFGIIHTVSPITAWDVALYTAGIPAIINPLIQIGYRYFKVI